MRLLLLVILPLLVFSLVFSGGFNTLKKIRPTPIPTPQNTYTIDATGSAVASSSGEALQLKTVKFTKHTPQPSAACTEQKLAIDMLLDTSGSMCPSGDCTKINSLKSAVITFGTKIGPDDIVAVQRFSSGSSTTFGGAPYPDAASVVLGFGPYSQSAFEPGVNSLQPGGNTNMRAGFTLAKSIMDGVRPTNADKKFVLIFFSDGRFNDGGNPSDVVNQIKASDVRIISVALGLGGTEYDPYFMRSVASAPTDFYESPTPEGLETIYEDIAADLCLD